jgi:hypothetical protein
VTSHRFQLSNHKGEKETDGDPESLLEHRQAFVSMCELNFNKPVRATAEQAEFERLRPQVEKVLPDVIRSCRLRIEHLQNLLISSPRSAYQDGDNNGVAHMEKNLFQFLFTDLGKPRDTL